MRIGKNGKKNKLVWVCWHHFDNNKQKLMREQTNSKIESILVWQKIIWCRTIKHLDDMRMNVVLYGRNSQRDAFDWNKSWLIKSSKMMIYLLSNKLSAFISFSYFILKSSFFHTFYFTKWLPLSALLSLSTFHKHTFL